MMLHRAESAPAPELTLMGEDLRRAADDVSRSCEVNRAQRSNACNRKVGSIYTSIQPRE